MNQTTEPSDIRQHEPSARAMPFFAAAALGCATAACGLLIFEFWIWATPTGYVVMAASLALSFAAMWLGRRAGVPYGRGVRQFVVMTPEWQRQGGWKGIALDGSLFGGVTATAWMVVAGVLLLDAASASLS